MAETTTEKSAAKTQEQTPEARPGWRESVESLLVTIILALFATCFVVQAFKIPSPSMEPTLLVGDHLLVNKFIFEGNNAWYDRFLPYRAIRHGDVIVFKFPFQDHPHYVKRVIGLPGDTIDYKDNALYINGQKMPLTRIGNRSYFMGDGEVDVSGLYREDLMGVKHDVLRKDFSIKDGEWKVPAGEYFMLGDNRNNSRDSRFWGFVPQSYLVGRAAIIWWSWDKEKDAVRWDRLGELLH